MLLKYMPLNVTQRGEVTKLKQKLYGSMKKLKLNADSFQNGTVLSRNELKKVIGGGILSSCFAWCDCPAGMTPIPGAGTLKMQVDCLGMCSAQNNVGAGCDSVFHSCASMDFSSYCV